MDAKYDKPTQAEVLQLQERFFISVSVCIGIIVLIHCVPKTRFTPESIRLTYTIAYFAAVLGLLYQLIGPLKIYLHALFAWRYEEAPEPTRRAAKLLLASAGQLIRIASLFVGAFVVSIAGLVLGHWFEGLLVLRDVFGWLWWASFLALAVFALGVGNFFTEAALLCRALQTQVELSRWFVPRSFQELLSTRDFGGPQKLAILSGLKFEAASIEWEWGDFVKNCIVFGQTGSGKTTCVMNSLLDGLIGSAAENETHASGLILDPKGTYLADVQALCMKYGRQNDLLVLNPNDANSIHWNPFDSADDEYELATRFAAVSRSLGMKDTTSSFWQTKSTMFMQYALELIRLTNSPKEPPSFAQINELVSSASALHERAALLDLNDPRCHDCLAFFANEWASMANETRTSIQAHLTGMLFPFLKEPFATKFAGRSTLRISDMLDHGKILYLHMPTADRETMARTIGIFLKLEFYKEVLKRARKTRPSFFFCDEFHKFFTAGSADDSQQEKSDADAFRLTRESFHANIVSTQNIGALGKPEVVQAFLSNCMTNIFLRNPDTQTNQFASERFGEEYVGNVAVAQAGRNGRLPGLGHGPVGVNDAEVSRCPPDRFRELAIRSSDQSIPHCESIVFLGGRSENPIPIRRVKWKAHPISLE